MFKYRIPHVVLSTVFAAATFSAVVSAGEPAPRPTGLDAFVGRWQINLERSKMGRAGPSGVQTKRSPTFTWVFIPDAQGLRMHIYPEYPAAAPSKDLVIIPDGKQHTCAMKESCLSAPGDPKEQSYAFTQVNSNALVRVFQIKGKDTEYNLYAVSQDGKSFVATSWNPETPEFQNVQVFERQP